MALHNEILAGRFNRFAQKLFGLKGGPPAPQLSSEIQLQHSLFHGAENRYTESWERFGMTLTAPAAVGLRSAVGLQNNVVGNVVIVVEKLLAANTGLSTDVPSLTSSNALNNAAAGNVSQRFDARSRLNAWCNAVISSNAGAITGSIYWRATLAPNTQLDAIVEENQELTLLPGSV